MKILTIHSDYMKFKPTKKALDNAEEASMELRGMSDCLVVFSAVEERDEEDVQGVVERFCEEVEDVAEQVKTNKIVLYPYAHLSSDLANPRTAVKVLEQAGDELEEDYEVMRAPFGWYKQFEIKCKGHPLSELSREFTAGEKKPTGEKERKEGSEFTRFALINSNGEVEEIKKDEWREAGLLQEDDDERVGMLRTFVRNELEGNVSKSAPKHVDIMRKLELYDYVEESDVGNLRSYPNGTLIFDLLKDYVLYHSALKLGCMKLQNPMMFDPDDPVINELVGDFHERDYRVLSDKKEFILRYASDPLNFPMLRDINITYKQMPFGIYEEAPSFRMEKRGECVGLKRLRSFNMLDVHFFTTTEKESVDKIEELCYNFDNMLNELIGDKWVLGWEVVEEYWEKYKDYFSKISKEMNVPTFVKIMPEMSHYFAFKNEYQAIGLDGSNVQVSTLQLDVKDGERFDINYVNSEGEEKPCFIIHTAPIGSLERCMYLVLENSVYQEERGEAPMLPLWLAPEQVRILPITDEHLEHALELSEELEENEIRVGVDDRDLTLGKKVYEAKSKWIPYIIVVGDDELETREYSTVIREESTLEEDEQKKLTSEELIQHIRGRISDLPYRPMYTKKLLSKRVTFVPWSE